MEKLFKASLSEREPSQELDFDFEIVITLNELVLSQKIVFDSVTIITVIELVLIQTRK